MDNVYHLPILEDRASLKKDARHRVATYDAWLSITTRPWYLPDLDVYCDFLLQEKRLSASSVMAHISTVKNLYRKLLPRPDVHELIAEFAPQTVNERSIFLSDALYAIHKATESSAGHLEARPQPQIKHLNQRQIDEILSRPNVKTRQGLRDLVIVGLMLCAGVSEVEISALDVQPFTHSGDGRWIIHVSETPGGKERFVAVFDDVLFDRQWLEDALRTLLLRTGVHEGAMFRGFYRGDAMRPGRVQPRALRLMLNGYSVRGAYGDVTFAALDLQRTYARRLYLAGIPVEIIQSNLGHKNVSTTFDYIGPPNVDSPDAGKTPGKAVPLIERIARWQGFGSSGK